jgi:hypothetical protein
MAEDAETASATIMKTKSEAAYVPNTETGDTYAAVEFEGASNRFNVPKECIRAALKEQKKAAYTMDEAAAIINNFLKREVK